MTVGLTNLGFDLSDVSTTAKFDLGAIHTEAGTEYTYIRAGGAIALGDFLVVKTDEALEPNVLVASSAVNQPIRAVAAVAIPSASHGWVVTRGRVSGAKVAASTAAGAQLGASATAGTATAITVSASPSQAEVQRVLAAAAGVGVIALDAEAGGVTEVLLR